MKTNEPSLLKYYIESYEYIISIFRHAAPNTQHISAYIKNINITNIIMHECVIGLGVSTQNSFCKLNLILLENYNILIQFWAHILFIHLFNISKN